MVIYLGGRKYPVRSAGENSVKDMEQNLFEVYGLTTRLQTFYYRDTLDGYMEFIKEDEGK